MVEPGVWEQLWPHRREVFGSHAAHDGRRDGMVRHGGAAVAWRVECDRGPCIKTRCAQVRRIPLPESGEDRRHRRRRRVPSVAGKSQTFTQRHHAITGQRASCTDWLSAGHRPIERATLCVCWLEMEAGHLGACWLLFFYSVARRRAGLTSASRFHQTSDWIHRPSLLNIQ